VKDPVNPNPVRVSSRAKMIAEFDRLIWPTSIL
jgi:hypothetical protein